MMADLQTALAQKIVLHMEGNQKAEYDVSQLDSINIVYPGSSGDNPSTDPSVTGDAIDITNKSATLVGYATSIRESLANDLRVGFIYCLEGTPNKNNGTQVTVNKNNVAEDGRYMATIENLLSGATYYFRSFVYQSGLWFYGKVKSFVTAGIDVNFITGDATDITCFSAKVSGSVDVHSSYSSLTFGICYGTSIEPTTNDNTQTTTSNNITLQLRQLTGGTTYYYRTYAIVDGQTYYGTVRTFRTLDDNVVETGDIDEETLTVTSHLTIGGGAYSSLVLGVCYGRTELPTVNDRITTSNEVDDENNYSVQLYSPHYYEAWEGSEYGEYGIIFYRAYVLIDGIPHYGSVKSFVRFDENLMQKLENMCYGAYRQMARTTSKLAIWGDLRSDSYIENNAIQSDIITHNRYIEIISGQPDSSMSEFDWSGVYITINYCNRVLQDVNETYEWYKQYISNEYINIHAEMTALRALNYFYLIRAFKDVPFTKKVINTDADVEHFPLTNQLVVLDSIINDCEQVKGKAYNQFNDKCDSKGRITNCAIYAMLADMYLWRASLHEGRHGKNGTDIVNGEVINHDVNNDYNKSIEYADLCLKSLAEQNAQEVGVCEETYNYGLTNCNMIKNNFEGAARTTIPQLEAQTAIFNTKNSCESIFELQYNSSDNLKNTFVNSLFGYGNGTHLMVNKDAIDALYDGGITSVGDNSGIWDSRIWVCCQNKLTTGSSSSSNVQAQSGYYCMKYHLPANDFLNMDGFENSREIKSLKFTSREYNNWIIYRMTDVMLIKAEALACLGESNLPQVKAICNAIHRRSYCNYRNPSKTPNIDANTGAIGNAYGTSKASTKTGVTVPEGIVCVMNERQIELIGEGKRWFDLVRLAERCSTPQYNGMNDPDDPREAEVKNGYTGMKTMVDLFFGVGSNATNVTRLISRFKNRYGLYSPIYYMETKASNGAIQQNPVWDKSQYEQ